MGTYRWRTVDIVVASVIAVAFGVIFWAWGLLYNGPAAALFVGFPPAAAIMNGVWLVPAVLAPLIIRKPGAALYAEFVAATVSALLGSAWGISTIWYGLAQGVAGELGFALPGWATGRMSWGVPQALFAAALAGAAAAGMDLYYYYADWATDWKLIYAALAIASTMVVAGVGSLLLTKALAGTGVLDRFPSGRVRELV